MEVLESFPGIFALGEADESVSTLEGAWLLRRLLVLLILLVAIGFEVCFEDLTAHNFTKGLEKTLYAKKSDQKNSSAMSKHLPVALR